MRKSIQNTVGQRIRAVRESLGLTQEQLADRCKCHRTYVGMVERAEKNISVLALSKFASALKTTMSKLLEGL
ncbi:MAG: helix-turn-helix transcriptional regulator [Planctomycetes bacterium]|nr:helix-turn-helix transcriptional regulator [Planctomycetota bacterium]